MVMAIWQKRQKQLSPLAIAEAEVQKRMAIRHGMIIIKTGIPQLRQMDLMVTIADQTEPRTITPVAVEWVACIDSSLPVTLFLQHASFFGAGRVVAVF
jgi:hypothetical protein